MEMRVLIKKKAGFNGTTPPTEGRGIPSGKFFLRLHPRRWSVGVFRRENKVEPYPLKTFAISFSLKGINLFKVFQEFLQPTVFVFILILAGSFLLFWKKKQGIGKKLIILGTILFYLFSITPVADLILKPLETRYRELKTEDLGRADLAVLLLGGGDSDVLRASEVLRISHMTNHRTKIIISGTDPLNPKSETAEATRRFFTSRGIPASNIIVDGKSGNTRESAKNVKEIVGKDPFFLITSAYHMERSIKTFQKAGTFPIPAPTDSKIKGKYNILDFFPDSENLKKSDLAFHEYFGIVFYWF
ncbi:MAG: hypothetical protein COX90_04120 [Candidatus Nealsonbacteria bacterium CG_4_10_14_0_2_um_filter_38_17]|uniref:DUF218 domain-containing protein n=1 Tax=Candidatus Nealsonbacteria bacterium CG_4_10_14_0_2_um_filter_38_17 TaxID=1974680 RepID=A0A2M7UX90_9BACT|nr:MAG: hypothetical protein COX90_04120 [Candidatus Nealsonbacteria bacterium CG_4_10_14_0_2_um_filter_38_17]